MDSPNKLVADYIFSSEHEDSDVSWLLRKLDRYNNGSMYNSELDPSGCCFSETPTSKLLSLKDQTGKEVAEEYICSSEHEESDVSWLLWRLDRYNNRVSYSSTEHTSS